MNAMRLWLMMMEGAGGDRSREGGEKGKGGTQGASAGLAHPARSLRVLIRRDPSRDRRDERVPFLGYEFFWPDGRPLRVGFDAFCRQGQRLLGLGRQLQGRGEQLIDLLCIPVSGDEDMTRLPGHRVRRFYLERHGRQGRLYFLDGTPTVVALDLDRDEAEVLHWFGLPELADGQRRWFDLAARAAAGEMP